jgi:FkbM family methyltransferase
LELKRYLRKAVHNVSSEKNATSIEKQAPMDLQPGNLVFDFGFYNGADSTAYLSAGFNVVAVEADPTLVQAAQNNPLMHTWMASGQLKLLNAAIAPDGDVAPTKFFMSKCTQEWNSFYSSIGCRSCEPPHTESPSACNVVPVKATTCAAVLHEYGVPQYFKLDIEGAESGCYKALSLLPKTMLPMFISGEVGNAELIDTLHGLGYTSFKLVKQSSGITGLWGNAALDCRMGNLWRSFLGAKQELQAMLTKAASPQDICPGSLVGGNWYDLHASRLIPQAW